jgi:hypothetical protein
LTKEMTMTNAQGSVSLEMDLDEGSSKLEDHATRSGYWLIPAIAGIGYAAAWMVGLMEWPTNLAINSPGKEVTALYSQHPSQAAAQYLLVEGVAGVLLGMVLIYLFRVVRRQCSGVEVVGAAVLGLAAAAVSVVQCALGLLLVSSAKAGGVARTDDLFALVNRLDGGKQLLLCASVIGLVVSVRPRSVLPRWLEGVASVLAMTLLPSGFAYLLLAHWMVWTAALALPLLLLFVAGSGIWLTTSISNSAFRPDRSI